MRRFDSIVGTTSNDLNAGSFGIFEICASKYQESSTHINSSLGTPPKNMENWSKWSFIVIPNCLPMCYPPGLTCGLHTFVYHFGSIPVELTYLGIENLGWKRDGEVKKNVYGKIHDHIFIHTKVCIYMHLLYFVYCIYILCNMYLSNIFEICFDAILYALKSLWKSPVHDMGTPETAWWLNGTSWTPKDLDSKPGIDGKLTQNI